MSRLTELLRQAQKVDPQLSADLEAEIVALTKRRSFGLVFEQHQPELRRGRTSGARRAPAELRNLSRYFSPATQHTPHVPGVTEEKWWDSVRSAASRSPFLGVTWTYSPAELAAELLRNSSARRSAAGSARVPQGVTTPQAALLFSPATYVVEPGDGPRVGQALVQAGQEVGGGRGPRVRKRTDHAAVHLFGSPANARRLLESYERGKTE